ncbi:RHS repeat-associated core domain protein [Limihaloglobus sulfuriphilus]|uniref:RHS repeat-associated core domain protein n=1 Tax=Limihaloglobus sulfuriphilus TaxID=1851148 RepID=A0A1Q2MBQ1_9BACT|nr:RHS repeat-associated core domain-containing protein [Limihaloglobus sulfuriphilus]AQQ69958.1 RHS repeat-associated core domain protein [Limihaloglobus sulfuriphilus]
MPATDRLYDNLGKLTGEASSSYTSDYLGNPTNAADDGLFYGLDAENRVVDVDDSYGDIAGYSYDMLGRRIKKTVGSLTTWFVYDKMGNVISEYEQIGTGSINWARDYVYGAGGEAVYMQMPPDSYTTVYEWFADFADAWLCSPDCSLEELAAWDTNNDDEIDSDDLVEWVPVIADEVFYSQRSYLLTDSRGSVIAKTNDVGGIDEIIYDAWGNASVAQGVDLQGLSVLWNGYYLDYETGNYYLRNRYYSPVERSFITEDPHGVNPDGNWNNFFAPLNQYRDGFSLAAFAQHDPVNGRDDWGLEAQYALGAKISDIFFTRAITPGMFGFINRFFRKDEYMLVDSELEIMNNNYDIRESINNFYRSQVRGIRGKAVFDENRVSGKWKMLSDGIKDIFTSGWWLGGAHWVSSKGSFDYCRGGNGNIYLSNVQVSWWWHDDIDAHNFKEALQEYYQSSKDREKLDNSLAIIGLAVEVLADIRMDKIHDSDFRVKVNWMEPRNKIKILE